MSYASKTYAEVVAGLHERFLTVEGLTEKTVLDYEPTSVQKFPTLYSLLDRADFRQAGQVKVAEYRIQHRLVFRWQDSEKAEEELLPYVDAVPSAVAADPRLGNRLVSGLAEIVEVEAGWDVIGGTLFRVLDFYSRVLVK